jgi:protein-S-isoprenylcysteine O-methyltransferase Ste14
MNRRSPMDELTPVPAKLAGAGVHFPPPFLFVGGLVVGWLLDRYWRALPLAAGGSATLDAVGLVVCVAGFALAAWGMLTFHGADTAIIPNRPASRLVASGPYRFTRNPMYIGLTIAYVGGAALVNSLWPLVLLPLVLVLLVLLVIRREEAYLADSFGAEYDAYRARVRRWI